MAKADQPLELWQVETAGHMRRAWLHADANGFEVRIVDTAGVLVESQRFESEPEAQTFAEERRRVLLAGGMVDER